MAVRAPLYWNGSELQEMSNAMVTELVTRAAYEFRISKAVSLSVVSSGGNLGAISDTRLQAGAVSTNRNAFPSEAATAEPSTVTVNYDRINSSTSAVTVPTDTSNTAFPLYWDGSGIAAMTLTDMYDTFGRPAVDQLVTANSLYTISTSTSVSGYTLVSSTPVFTDTRADTSLYTAAGIPEALDQPTTIANFYLLEADAGTAPSFTSPMQYVSGEIVQYTSSNFASVLSGIVRSVAVNDTGYKISFNFNGAGTNTGSIVNTILNGSGNYQTLYNNTSYYSAQEFPDGTAISNTNYLRVTKV